MNALASTTLARPHLSLRSLLADPPVGLASASSPPAPLEERVAKRSRSAEWCCLVEFCSRSPQQQATPQGLLLQRRPRATGKPALARARRLPSLPHKGGEAHGEARSQCSGRGTLRLPGREGLRGIGDTPAEVAQPT